LVEVVCLGEEAPQHVEGQPQYQLGVVALLVLLRLLQLTGEELPRLQQGAGLRIHLQSGVELRQSPYGADLLEEGLQVAEDQLVVVMQMAVAVRIQERMAKPGSPVKDKLAKHQRTPWGPQHLKLPMPNYLDTLNCTPSTRTLKLNINTNLKVS